MTSAGQPAGRREPGVACAEPGGHGIGRVVRACAPVNAPIDPLPTTEVPPQRLPGWVLLATSSLTVMAGATIAPGLPSLAAHFRDVPHVDLLAKMVLTVPALAIALCASLAGALVDRVGRRRVLVASCLLFALAGASGAVLSSLPAILVGRALLGVAVAGAMTSATALIADLFAEEARPRFLGLQAAAMSFGGVVFLPLGGGLAELSWRAPFLVYLVALPLAFVALAVLPDPRPTPRAKGAAPVLPAARWGRVVALCGLGFVGMGVFYTVPTQLPFHLERTLGATPIQSGLAIAFATVFAGTSSLAYARVRPRLGFRGTFVAAYLLMASGLGLLFVAASFPLALAAMAGVGSGMGLLMPNLNVLLVEGLPGHLRGRAVGALTASLFLGQFLSPLLTQPIVASSGGGQAAFGFAGASLLVLAAIVAVFGGGLQPRAAAGRSA